LRDREFGRGDHATNEKPKGPADHRQGRKD
jgi:hypothetical protein